MRIFLLHIVMVVVAGMFAHDNLRSIMGGLAEAAIYLAAFFMLWLSSYFYSPEYFRKFHRLLMLSLYFLKELWVSNLEVVYYVITPRLQFQPAILELELRLKKKRNIALLANLITLTPGTLTLEVSEDHKRLYFHTLNVPNGDVEAAREKIRNGFEKRILAIENGHN